VSALGGCGTPPEDESAEPEDVVATVSPTMATVVRITWNTEAEVAGYVAYGPTPELGLTTPLEPEATHAHTRTLAGLRADTDYSFKVVSPDGEESEVQTIRTGVWPQGLPQLAIEGTGHDGLVVAPIIGNLTAVTIFDGAGEIVWYHDDTSGLDVYRARVSNDGASILYNAATVSGDAADPSAIVRISLDGSSVQSIPVPLLAHDFVEHPDGTIGAIVVEYRDFQGAQLRGDKLVEIAPDGTQTTVWSAWDCFDPAVVTGDNPEQGWTFSNALDYDPVEQAYYLGMRNFSSIVKIDRATRACLWVFGSTGATIEMAQEADRFYHQHQFDLQGTRILVFDNEGAIGNESRVLEYELDFAAMRAQQVSSYVADPTVSSFVLGEPIRLQNGDMFVNWSAAGQMERVDAAGQWTWKVNLPLGSLFGFNTLIPSFPPPS